MPPSADDMPGRKPPRDKPRRGSGKRKPGKQPGAPGSHLAWSENPDKRVPHFPGGACECGADLAGASDLGVTASHQEVEAPLASAQVIQHDLHLVACGCGRVHQAAPPAGAGAAGTVTYGLSVQAWCVFLIAAHAIPVHRCAELIEALTGARPSPGFVHSMIGRAAATVAQANKLIRALIILAHVMTVGMSVRASQTRSAGPRLGREAMRTRFPPRPVAAAWPAGSCDRQTAIRLATAAPLVISNPVVQAKRVRGLRHLLDWLAGQPGDTWQQRWASSGAETLGARWRQASITWLAARGRRSSWLPSELSSALLALILPMCCVRRCPGWSARLRSSPDWPAAWPWTVTPAGSPSLVSTARRVPGSPRGQHGSPRNAPP